MSETRKLFESIQNSLNEAEEKLNVFDIVDLDYVLTELCDSKTVYLTGDISDIIKSLKNNGCEIKNYTENEDSSYCDVLYNNHILNLDSFSDDNHKEVSCILTGATFYYGGTTEYSKYEINFIIEGNIKDQGYLKEEILDYLRRVESDVEYAKIKVSDFKMNKI